MADNPLSTQMQALIDYSNGVTGESDTDLSAVIDHLTAGYGSGGSSSFQKVFEYTYNLADDFSSISQIQLTSTGDYWANYLPENPTIFIETCERVDVPDDYDNYETSLLTDICIHYATANAFNANSWSGEIMHLDGSIAFHQWSGTMTLGYAGNYIVVLARCNSTTSIIQAGTYKFTLYRFA